MDMQYNDTRFKWLNQIVSSQVKVNYKQASPMTYITGSENIPVSQAATYFKPYFTECNKNGKKQNNIRPSQILLEHNFEVSNSVQHINNGRCFVPFLTQLPICHQLNSYITKANKSSGLKCALKCLQGDDSNNNTFKEKQRRSWPIKTFKISTHLFGMEHLPAEGQPAIKKK